MRERNQNQLRAKLNLAIPPSLFQVPHLLLSLFPVLLLLWLLLVLVCVRVVLVSRFLSFLLVLFGLVWFVFVLPFACWF